MSAQSDTIAQTPSSSRKPQLRPSSATYVRITEPAKFRAT
jgi:hypothetical protein